jgi:hypothetical protein
MNGARLQHKADFFKEERQGLRAFVPQKKLL